jgi:maltose alpha-D-glucosyltransferase/alpha-amylase
VAAPVLERAAEMRDRMSGDFLAAYWPVAEEAGILPGDREERDLLLDLFTIQKAFYEIGYEAANRPAWLSIPIRGLLDLIASDRPAA